MDIASLFGIVCSFGLILLGFSLDGGNVKSLLLVNAVMIVLGGSVGAICVAYGVKQLKQLPKLFVELFTSPKSTISKTIEYLLFLAQTARQNGLLSLEKTMGEEEAKGKLDPFLKRGILMVLDGAEPEEISEVLQNDIYIYEQNKRRNINMMESLGGFGPALGMIGTLTGLVNVLSAGMGSPEEMTKAIGTAFVATLYGVMLANLLFLPATTKLKDRVADYRLEKELIIEGVCAIRNGVNARLLEERLSTYYILENSKQGLKKREAGSGRGEKASEAK
jgi:chemotaxis protein MotA